MGMALLKTEIQTAQVAAPRRTGARFLLEAMATGGRRSDLEVELTPRGSKAGQRRFVELGTDSLLTV